MKIEFDYRLFFKRLGLVILLTAFLLAVLNFQYFYKNLMFAFKNPKAAQPIQVKSKPNMLAIESLGIEAPVIYPEEKTELAFQKALLAGVAHYPGTADPGQSGNVYIFGHSSDFSWSQGKYKSVFALLPKIAIGSEIKISNQQGTEFKYIVIDKKVVARNDLSVLAQDPKQHLLTLQTSYPIGTALRRFVVVAELVR